MDAGATADLYGQFAVQAASRQNNMAELAANRQNDAAQLYADDSRRDYLKNKDNISFAQGTGQRMVDESGSGRVRTLDNTGQPTSSTKPA